MSTALVIPISRGVVLAQSAWDRFFQDALVKFTYPNPDLNRDLALDKTIRALGHRPRAPLTPEEREDLEVRAEVEHLFATAGPMRGVRLREYLEGLDSTTEPDPDDEPQIEDLCDALEDCEVTC